MTNATERAPLWARIRDLAETINTPIRFVHEALHHARAERRSLKRLKAVNATKPKLVLVLSAPKTASTSVLLAAEKAIGEFTVIRAHHAQSEARWPGAGTRLVTTHGGLRHRAYGDIMMLPFWGPFRGNYGSSPWCATRSPSM